jgi:hypothetical protein
MLAVTAAIALFVGLLLPVHSKGPVVVNTADTVMKKVYRSVLDGLTKSTILERLSDKEKGLLDKYGIAWLESVPVVMESRELKPVYLPTGHVVVYGTPKFRAGRKTWREDAYINAVGVEYSLRGQGARLEKLVRTTRLGTAEILQGSTSEISDIPNIESYDQDMVFEYLLLKKLACKDPGYVAFAVEIITYYGGHLQTRADSLLKASIVAPQPPSSQQHFTEEFRTVWREWYANNSDDVEITNEFLFQETDVIK